MCVCVYVCGEGEGDMKISSSLKGGTEIFVTFIGGTVHFYESQSNSRSLPAGGKK